MILLNIVLSFGCGQSERLMFIWMTRDTHISIRSWSQVHKNGVSSYICHKMPESKDDSCMPLTAEVYLYIRGPLHPRTHAYMITHAYTCAQPLSLIGCLHLVLTFIWGDHKWPLVIWFHLILWLQIGKGSKINLLRLVTYMFTLTHKH